MTENLLTRALPALVLGVCLAGGAAAQTAPTYPVTSTTTSGTGRISSSGIYRPLELNLNTLLEFAKIAETNSSTAATEITYVTGLGGTYYVPQVPSWGDMYTAVFTGGYEAYGPSGSVDKLNDPTAAGVWVYVLDPALLNPGFSFSPPYPLINGAPDCTTDPTRCTSTFADFTPNINSTDPAAVNTPVGYLLYLGGGNFTGVQVADTPQAGDLFELFPDSQYVAGSPLYRITKSTPGADDDPYYLVELLDDLTSAGPKRPTAACTDGNWLLCAYQGKYAYTPADLDLRTSLCNDTYPCTVSGYATSAVVPIPAAFPLFGSALGLLALLGYRRRMAAG